MVIGLTLFFCCAVLSQDTSFLATVEVVDTYLFADSTAQKWTPGQLSAAQSIFSNEMIYLRSNGPGALSTIAFRGNAPHQMPVLWQGINLQNSMNGVVDLSLLPAAFYTMQMEAGHSISTGHSQNHRALTFSTPNRKDAMILAGISLGSYGQRQVIARFNIKSKLGRTILNYSNQFAENDFRYRDITSPGQPIRSLQNAAFASQHAGLDHFWEYKNQKLGVHFLYSAADRQIPPSLTEVFNNNSQQDTSFRITLIYNINFLKDSLCYQPAVLIDINEYLTDRHITRTQVHNLAYRRKWTGAFESELKYILENQVAKSTSFASGDISRLRQDFILQSSFRLNAFIKLSFSSRWTQPQQFKGALSYQLSADLAGKWIASNLKIGRSWQFPTLNDLYWPISGNFALRPEKSDYFLLDLNKDFTLSPLWTMDAGLALEWKQIEDYILWRPISGSLWGPSNVKQVEIRCIDPHLTIKWKGKYGYSSFRSNFQYLSAISNKVYDSSQSGSLNKQLIYTPVWQWRNQLQFRWKRKWSSTISHTYLGERSGTSDHSHSLNPAHLLSCSVMRDFKFRRLEYSLGVNAENILNTEYQLIAYRPMPGFTANFNLIIKLI
jgi:vitamin B12 transporter